MFFITIVMPKFGIEKNDHMVKNHKYLIGGVSGFFLGVYGGFYGAGTATFLCYILILLFKQTFLECAATVKIAALLMCATAASIFAINGAALCYKMANEGFQIKSKRITCAWEIDEKISRQDDCPSANVIRFCCHNSCTIIVEVKIGSVIEVVEGGQEVH